MVAERIILGAVFFLGAWVRLSGLDLGWFLQDQVRDGMTALGILSGREFPLVGPLVASSQIYLAGPLYYYLVAIPYAFSTNPAVGVGFLNLLNLTSVYLTYRLGTEMFGTPVGTVAAALYAVFPMAVLSSKALWNPGFLPFFTSVFLLTLWRYLQDSRPWRLGALIALVGILLQIHMSGAIFAVLLPVALWLYRSPLPLRPLVAGLLCAALLYAPYLVFEAQHGFPDARRFLSWADQNIWNEAGQSYWLIAGRAFWTPFLLPERMMAALPHAASPPIFPWAQRVELALLILGLVALGILLAKARDRRPYVLLALWLALPFAIFPHNRVRVMWFYFDVLYPSQFLVIGLLTRCVPEVWRGARPRPEIRKWLQAVVGVVLGVLVLAQVWFAMAFERAVERSGVLRMTTDIVLSFPDPEWKVGTETVLETMPLRFKRALAGRFRTVFGVEPSLLERATHGAIYQELREDKGFAFLTIPRPGSGPPDPRLHYAILRNDSSPALSQGRELRVGPYRILAYHPLIRYESWRWSPSPSPGWTGEGFDDSAWSPLTIPARRAPDQSVYEPVPLSRWSGRRMAARGWMDVPSPGRPLWLVLNIRDDYSYPHQVRALYLNGSPVMGLRVVSYNAVSFRNIEVVAELTSAIRAGSNLIAMEITGPNEEFDLDLYELRPAK